MKLNAPALVVRSVRLTIAGVAAIIISACSEPVAPGAMGPSTFPSQVPSPSLMESVETQRNNLTFPLLNGSVRVVLLEGNNTAGTINGDYSGSSSNSIPGRATATLGIRIRNTTGAASGITAVKADGTGAFIGEGTFTLSLSLATAQGSVVAKVQGTSVISSCSADQRIVVTMRGTGSAPRIGKVAVELQHEVGSTGCFD